MTTRRASTIWSTIALASTLVVLPGCPVELEVRLRVTFDVADPGNTETIPGLYDGAYVEIDAAAVGTEMKIEALWCGERGLKVCPAEDDEKRFATWSRDGVAHGLPDLLISSSLATYQLVVTGANPDPILINVKVVPPSSRLMVEVGAGGEVMSNGVGCRGTCPFVAGDQLKASPFEGFQFNRWEGACSRSNPAPEHDLLESDSDCSASFKKLEGPLLRVVVDGLGSVSSEDLAGFECDTSCEVELAPGANVSLTATPIEPEAEITWTGKCVGDVRNGRTQELEDGRENVCTISFVPPVMPVDCTIPPPMPKVTAFEYVGGDQLRELAPNAIPRTSTFQVAAFESVVSDDLHYRWKITSHTDNITHEVDQVNDQQNFDMRSVGALPSNPLELPGLAPADIEVKVWRVTCEEQTALSSMQTFRTGR